MGMDFSWISLVAAAAGGFAGGLMHGSISDNKFGTDKRPDGQRDWSAVRDLGVGTVSGIVWLLPNQNAWVSATTKPSQIVITFLQTLVIGLAGSGWLTSYLNTDVLKGAIKKAAEAQPDREIAVQMTKASSVNQIVDLVSKLTSKPQSER